jgi:hypothetical protein
MDFSGVLLMIKYIVIDENGYPVGQSHLSNAVNHSTLVKVSDFSEAENKMWSGVKWIQDDRVKDIVIRGITQDEFRKRIPINTLMKLDKLEVRLENDSEFDSLCPNVVPATREAYRDGMRTAFRNLSSEKLIFLNHPIAISGITLFSDAGVIPVSEKDAMLDASDLEE